MKLEEETKKLCEKRDWFIPVYPAASPLRRFASPNLSIFL